MLVARLGDFLAEMLDIPIPIPSDSGGSPSLTSSSSSSSTLGATLREALLQAWARSEEEYHLQLDLATGEGLEEPALPTIMLRQWAGGRLIPLVEQEDPQAEEGDEPTKLDVPSQAGWPRLWEACIRRELVAMQLTSTILERARQALSSSGSSSSSSSSSSEDSGVDSADGRWSGWYGPLIFPPLDSPQAENEEGEGVGVQTSWADLFHLWSLRLTFTQPARAQTWADLFGLTAQGPWGPPTVLAWTLRMELWVDWDPHEDPGEEDHPEDEEPAFQPSKVEAAWSWELNPLLRTADQPYLMGWAELRYGDEGGGSSPSERMMGMTGTTGTTTTAMWTTPLSADVQPAVLGSSLGSGSSSGDSGAWNWDSRAKADSEPLGALRALVFNLEWSSGTQQAWLAGDGEEGSAMFHPPLIGPPPPLPLSASKDGDEPSRPS